MSEMILTDERFRELMRAVETALVEKGITDEEAADLITRAGWLSGLPETLKHNRKVYLMVDKIDKLSARISEAIEDEVTQKLDAALKSKGDAS
jgi:hypothetical protein